VCRPASGAIACLGVKPSVSSAGATPDFGELNRAAGATDPAGARNISRCGVSAAIPYRNNEGIRCHFPQDLLRTQGPQVRIAARRRLVNFNSIWKDFVMQLHGKRVVIIGGSSGIGLETARLALAEGAFVTIAGRSEERLRRASESIAPAGERLRAVVADLSEESSVQSLFARESRVDHVFVPAGELRPGGGDLMKADVDALRSILEVRVLGVTHVVRHAGPKMEDGSITLMSGLYSTRPAPGVGMAVAALGAVEGLTRALALDLAPIRVNAVAPGVIDTPLWDSFGAQREAILARGAKLPVGRIGRPEEVAAAVIFLMGNGFVTGAVLPIDGGGRLV
jgi:NAD(P)-dependent dehydrogenase (short-subunit alcohol dehydrogenase family)